MDDGLACPSISRNNPYSPASFFTFAAGHHPVLEFESCDVAEQWLEDGEGLDTLWGGAELEASGGSALAGNDDLSGKLPPKRRRGQKSGPRAKGPIIIRHVEAERQRQDKLNRRFCELRSGLPCPRPTVSWMDKASLLANAAAYIAKLRDRVQQLEVEAS